MGRYHPTYCKHGKVTDWWDFGPDHTCDEFHHCPNRDEFHFDDEPGTERPCECDDIDPPSECAACIGPPPCFDCANDRAIRWAAACDRMRDFLDSRSPRHAEIGNTYSDALLFILDMKEDA